MIWSAVIVLASLWTLKVEVPRLRKEKLYKELWVFLIAISISALVSVAVSLQLLLLNPLELIAYLFRPMGKMITTLLT
ncbi:hypothetical protein [Paenibacillus oryzisoli]|uniref:Uncharacterized protein n=1 Tax=Paenibacillus oryzisoli TaxID=1850517 RepID=A0A198A0P7_9BACL|nr:hypothetical protein [Paenibacillus oryzisoli]OAS14672.1 hypothetical protein A8708_23485 [Paenibacillus oryzisoli]